MSYVDLHWEAFSAPFPQVVRELINALGLSYVTSLADVRETRSVREWAEGARTPRGSTESRLRLAYWVVTWLQREAGLTVSLRPWFELPNPQMDWDVPGRLIREGDVEEIGPRFREAMSERGNPKVVPFESPKPSRRRHP